MLVHVLKYVFNANLLAIAYRPHAVELQTLDDGTLENEYRCSTRATDEVDTKRIQVWYRQCENTMMVAIQESDTVGTDQGCPVFLAGVENALLEFSTGLCLFAKAR